MTAAFLPGTNAQNCALACDGAQISLDEECMAEVTVAMIAADTTQCPAGIFVVYVLTLDDDTIPTSPFVTEDEIGVPLKAVLYDTESGQSCWSNITVEDKMPPQLTCNCPPVDDPDLATEDCIINCLDAVVYELPDVEDNCTDALPILINEELEPICHPRFIKRMVRTYTAMDEYGNYSDTCMQELYLERIDFGLIDWPDSLTVLGMDPVQCDANFLDLDEDGVPDPAPLSQGGAGVPRIDGQPVYPEFIGYCNSQIFVEDVVIGPVGCVTKIMRMWRAFEWHCLGETDTLYIQLIEIVDDEGPDLTCPPDVTVTTNAYDCEALILIPVPDATDNCNEVIQISAAFPGGFANNLLDMNGVYVDLPVGANEITYTAYDACYNSSQCVWTVVVEDHTPPVPICDEHTIVSLTTDGMNGLTLVNASAFDDGSYDECGDVTFLARRMTSCIDFDWTTFGAGVDEIPDGDVDTYDRGQTLKEYVPFACCDVGEGPIMIEVRVTDESGNHNTCMVEIEVQDKIGPEIDCPADITISCEFDYDMTNLSIFGTVETDEELREEICIFDPTNPDADVEGFVCIGLDGIATDNCGVVITENSIPDLNNCGIGEILRTFTATDPGGRPASCQQLITVVNFDPFYINPNNPYDLFDDVIWPPNVDVTGCGSDIDPEVTEFPIFTEDECDLIGYTYEDVVFPFVQGACFKILRTWQVIDWCQFEASSQSPSGYLGLWEYQQVIKVLDDDSPEFTTAQPDISECNEFDCDDLFIELIQMGSDDCTPDEDMQWSLGIDFDNDGSITPINSGTGVVIDASRNFPIGTHRVIYSFEDNCGNQTTREQLVTVLACKAPTPLCFFGLSADLMPVDTDNDGETDWGMITIWASDFDKGSFHACGYSVTVSFSPDSTDQSRTFTCDEVGVVPVQIWVTDHVIGEQAYCETFIDIQDNMEACDGDGISTGVISGLIQTESTDNVNQVQVDLDGSGMFAVNTDQTGQFTFPSMPFGGTYNVVPFKNTDWMNGVSTLDLIGIQKHLLGMEHLGSPYTMIAADANNSGAISAVDLVLLRKLILGVITELPDNTSWRFVDAAYEFNNPNDPLGEDFPESYEIPGFLNSMPNVNFVGIKVGDVNNTVQAGAITGETETSGSLSMRVMDRQVKAGEAVQLTFTAEEAGELLGYQFTLNFDQSALTFESFESAALEVNDDNFGMQRLESGVITTSWSQAYPVDVASDEELFVLNLRATRGGSLRDMISIGSDLTKAEAYDAAGEIRDVKLDFETVEVAPVDTEFALMQNQPNPFSQNTTISFTLPQADKATLSVFDLTGRTIYTSEMDAAKGYNEVRIEAASLSAEGVLYYTVQTGEFSATRKMIRLK